MGKFAWCMPEAIMVMINAIMREHSGSLETALTEN
jgi:hypothetical protein